MRKSRWFIAYIADLVGLAFLGLAPFIIAGGR